MKDNKKTLLLFGPICCMMWHARVVVWHGGRCVSGRVRFPVKWWGVVAMREGGNGEEGRVVA
jgi:hypothetical protein